MRTFRSNRSVNSLRRLSTTFKTPSAKIYGKRRSRMPGLSSSVNGCGKIVITVKIVPGSSRTESAGMHGQMYKIKIAAPPEKGKANKMLIMFLAEQLTIRKNAVQIKSGQTSVVKQVLLQGVTKQDVQAHLG
ncbi:MAG: YggU family protein [Planctomycetota bacterium]|nr:MAG: YggU family protein [Planctomycetota bacterium]